VHGASETVSSEHDVEDADSSQPTQKKIGKDRNKDKTGKKELSIDHGSVTTCEKFGNKSGKVSRKSHVHTVVRNFMIIAVGKSGSSVITATVGAICGVH